jgi:hypothetical protein
MAAAQEVRCGQAGNTRADHRNRFHGCSEIPVRGDSVNHLSMTNG